MFEWPPSGAIQDSPVDLYLSSDIESLEEFDPIVGFINQAVIPTFPAFDSSVLSHLQILAALNPFSLGNDFASAVLSAGVEGFFLTAYSYYIVDGFDFSYSVEYPPYLGFPDPNPQNIYTFISEHFRAFDLFRPIHFIDTKKEDRLKSRTFSLDAHIYYESPYWKQSQFDLKLDDGILNPFLSI